MKKYDESMPVGRPYGNITVVERGGKLEYRVGRYVFKAGIVDIYDEPNYTRFDFVFDQKLHIRTINDKKNKIFTDRSLKIMAGKFAMEIITKNNIELHRQSFENRSLLDGSSRQ
jgi:hypothetical protein